MNQQKHPVFNTLMTLVCFVFVVTMAVSLIIYMKPLYYVCVKAFKIPETTGYSYEVCRRNYNILIDYNMIWGAKELVFQDFAMSMRGKVHFIEVKRIFLAIQYAFFGTGLLMIAGIIASKKLRSYLWLKMTIIFSIIVVAVLGLMLAVDWDGFFVGMHHILFNNDYWLFDPVTDPIIEVLPDGFFLVCAVGILVMITLGLVLCGLFYRKQTQGLTGAAQNAKGSAQSGKTGSSAGGKKSGSARGKKSGSGKKTAGKTGRSSGRGK